MFLERLSVFDYANNKYYKPEGTFNNRSAYDPIAIPNCTMYAFLRMHEASEQDERQNYWIRSSGGFGNAKTWYDSTTLPKGSTPRVGAIAVWDGTYGHVNVVEKVIDSTHVIMSESNYSDNKDLRDWHFFNMRDNVEVIAGQSRLPGTGVLLGFIYPPVNDLRVSRNTEVDQVEIISTKVNVRKGPGLCYEVFARGLYCPEGIFNVEDWEDADGYTWAKLDDNCWVACGDWANIYKGEAEDKTIKELKAEIKELKSANKSLESENNKLSDKLSLAKEKVDELAKILK